MDCFERHTSQLEIGIVGLALRGMTKYKSHSYGINILLKPKLDRQLRSLPWMRPYESALRKLQGQMEYKSPGEKCVRIQDVNHSQISLTY